MANELNLRISPNLTGLTVVARLRNPGGAQQGSDITMTENGSVAGFYAGDMPAAPAQIYTVDFVDTGLNRLLAVGEMHWSGTEELTVEDTVEDIAAIPDAVWDEILSGHQTVGSAGRALALAGTPIQETTLTGSPTMTAMQLVAGSTLNDAYNEQSLLILNGAAAGQVRIITDYVGATKQCLFQEGFEVAPSSGDVAIVLPTHIWSESQIESFVQLAMTAQGYTFLRAQNLDNLDASITSVLAAIAALDDLSAAQVTAAVQAGLTAQGYTTSLATELDGLDPQVASILTGTERIRKIVGNKVVVSVDELTVTVYEDNGTTVAFQFAISADKLTRTPI